MAILEEKKFREEIQKGKLRSLYVWSCEDPFKLDFFAKEISRLFPQGFSIRQVYADELEISSLLDSHRNATLWDSQKITLVRHAERFNAKQWEAFIPLIEEDSEKSSLILLTNKVDGRLKFFQALQKAKDQAVLVKMELAYGPEWNQWSQLFLKEVKKELDDEARQLLNEWTAGSLTDLKQTIERAALYSGGAPKITREHIAAVGFRVAPEDVFKFTAGLMAGDQSLSLSTLESLLRQGEEPLALIGLILRQYRWLLAMLSLRAEGKGDAQIAADCGIFPSAAKVLFPAARRLGGRGVIYGISKLAEADYSLKSSRLPQGQVLTKLVLQLTN